MGLNKTHCSEMTLLGKESESAICVLSQLLTNYCCCCCHGKYILLGTESRVIRSDCDWFIQVSDNKLVIRVSAR